MWTRQLEPKTIPINGDISAAFRTEEVHFAHIATWVCGSPQRKQPSFGQRGFNHTSPKVATTRCANYSERQPGRIADSKNVVSSGTTTVKAEFLSGGTCMTRLVLSFC